MLTLAWHYLRAFIIIYLSLFVGNWLAGFLPIVIPGSIIGMLILFLLLTLRIITVDWIKPGCLLLIRYMALLFVPIGVGIMNYYGPLSQQLGPVVISCVVSTLLTMFVVGLSAHFSYGSKQQ
jgi:holin-like protein